MTSLADEVIFLEEELEFSNGVRGSLRRKTEESLEKEKYLDFLLEEWKVGFLKSSSSVAELGRAESRERS